MMQVKPNAMECWRYCRDWASWYCGAPFIFMTASLGSAGIGNLKMLETLRPLFIAVTANCLVYAYRKLGQASTQICQICSVCTDARTLRTYRTCFWAVAALALAPIGFPYVLYLLLGAAAGFFSGLFGIGGGIIIVPFLVLLFSAQGFAPDLVLLMSVATSLSTIIVTSTASLYAHHRLGVVDWPVVKQLVPSFLVGSLLGSVVADSLPTDLFKTLFAFFPLWVAFQMIKPYSPALDPDQPSGGWNLSGAGGIIGALCTLLGAGVGVITVPFLVKRRFPLRQAMAISSACGLPLAIIGSLGYIALSWGKTGLPSWSLGYLYVPVFLCIVTSSRVFAPIGAQLAHKLPTEKLKRIFALFLFAVGMRLLWQAVS
jgi:uncharacterized membrane protein YfcA